MGFIKTLIDILADAPMSSEESNDEDMHESGEHFVHIDSDGDTHAVQQDDSVPFKINTK